MIDLDVPLVQPEPNLVPNKDMSEKIRYNLRQIGVVGIMTAPKQLTNEELGKLMNSTTTSTQWKLYIRPSENILPTWSKALKETIGYWATPKPKICLFMIAEVGDTIDYQMARILHYAMIQYLFMASMKNFPGWY